MTETYGYDKTPTPPRDYDVNKVPAEIRKRTEWVKSKFTGEDVAEAYRQAGDIAGIYAGEAKRIAERTQIRQDAVEDFNAQVIQEMTDKDVISAPEIIAMRDGEATAGERLERDYAKLYKQIDLNPDMFEGTDIEKLQQVFDYAKDNGLTKIRLNREYDLTGGSVWIPEGAWNTPLSYITFYGGKLRKDDSGFMFDSKGGNNDTGVFRIGPSFNGTDFDGITYPPREVHVFNGSKMTRMNVVDCYFRTVGLVKSEDYLQTLRVENCITGFMGCHFIEAQRSYDVELINMRCEANQSEDKRVIQLVSPTAHASYYGLKITGGLMEGFWNTHPIEIGGGFGLDISGVYFERNISSIVIKSVPGAINKVVGKIDNCVFLHNEGDGQDIMMDDDVEDINLLIENNSKRRDEPGGATSSGQYLTNRRPRNPRNSVNSNVNFLGATPFPDMYRLRPQFVEVSGSSSIEIVLPSIPIKDVPNKLWLLSTSYNPNKNTYSDNQIHKVGILSVTTDGLTSSVLYTPLLGGDYSMYYFVESTSKNLPSSTINSVIRLMLPNGAVDSRNVVAISELSHIASQ